MEQYKGTVQMIRNILHYEKIEVVQTWRNAQVEDFSASAGVGVLSW